MAIRHVRILQILLPGAPLGGGGGHTVPIMHWEILLHPSPPHAPLGFSPPRTEALPLPPSDCLTSAP